MNFYKHHIGDYAQATAHLSFVEDAAYSRMLRKYYAEEKPLPADLKLVQRLVAARTREEREAVDTVLQEFFSLEPDGWHNKRADAELVKANAQAEANRKVAEEREARRRARIEGERSANEAGTIRSAAEHDSLNDSFQSREPSQTPDTRHQTPDTTTSVKANTATSDEVAPARPSPDGSTGPPLTLVDPPAAPAAYSPPQCPHQAILAAWAETLPAMPQHQVEHWNGARADHLRARWRETADAKRWPDSAAGIAYFRKLFAYVGQSRFLTGKVPPREAGKRAFVIELEWLVSPGNWARVHEGKYHTEAAA